MREYQVSYRGNRLVTKDNIIDVLNELGYQPGGDGGGLRLISITSWYLKTDLSSGVVVNHPENPTLDNPAPPKPGWQIGFILPDLTYRYVWKFSDYHYGDPDHEEIEGFHIYTNCELVSIYSSSDTSMGIDFIYTLFSKEISAVHLDNDGSGDYPHTEETPITEWTRDLSSLAYGVNAYLWMSQRKINGETAGNWSIPIRLSGEDGSPGADGVNIQFCYKHMNRLPIPNSEYPEDNPYSQGVNDNEIPDGWNNHPSGVGYFTETNNGVEQEVFYRYEWATYRLRKIEPEGSVVWEPWSDPFVWSAYGEKGMDGDGVEYVYKLFNPTTDNPVPEKPNSPKFTYGNGSGEYDWYGQVYLSDPEHPEISNNWRPKDWEGTGFNTWIGGKYGSQGEWIPEGWEDNPTGVSETDKVEWVSQRKFTNSRWGQFSDPKIWATFSKEHTVEIIDGEWWIDGVNQHIKAEGENGKGIDLKGRVDFLDSDHETRFMQENPDFSFEPGHVVTYLKDVDDETSDDFRDPEVGDCYVVTYNGHIYLYIGGDDEDWKKHWHDFGEFQGEGAYVHIAWADNVEFSPVDHETIINISGFVLDKRADRDKDYNWMGICTDHNWEDPDDYTKYKWNHARGRDGDSFERVFIRTEIEQRPLIGEDLSDSHGHTKAEPEFLPYVTNIEDNLNVNPPIYNCHPDSGTNVGSQANPRYQFTDDPQGVTSTLPYEWVAERKKEDGQWKSFNRATLWATYSHDGQSILRSTLFKRSEDQPDPPQAAGSFQHPNPENSGWSDGIPSGTGPIWKTEKLFTSDGEDPQWDYWTTPVLVQDDDNMDVELSMESRNTTPHPAPPVKYEEATTSNKCNSHRPQGYDLNLVEDQIWYDPELDRDTISANSGNINWMATRYKYVTVDGEPAWKPWSIILIKGEDGGTGSSGIGFQHAYISVSQDYVPNIVESPQGSGRYYSTVQGATGEWTIGTMGVVVNPGEFLWMSERTVQDGTYGPWGNPIRLSGDNGQPGEDAENIEFIYKRSNRLPNNTSTNNDKPTLNDYTSDGFIPNYDEHPGTDSSYNIDQNSGWTDNPQGVGYFTEGNSEVFYKYEWMCQRIKPRTSDPNELWLDWSNVFVWSAYGDTGMDGDGVEYIYTRNSSVSNTAPDSPYVKTQTHNNSTGILWEGGVYLDGNRWKPKDLPASEGDFIAWIGGEYNPQGEWIPEGSYDNQTGNFVEGNWTDEPKGVEENKPYEWVSQRKCTNGKWGNFSKPTVWANYTTAPEITIDENGNWCVNGDPLTDKDGNPISAEGPAGQGIQLKDTVDVIQKSEKQDYSTEHNIPLADVTSLQEVNPLLNPEKYGDIAPGDCYVVKNNRYLYVCINNAGSWSDINQNVNDGTWDFKYNWAEVGEFQGEPGLNSYMHIAWAASIDKDPVKIEGDYYTVQGNNINFDSEGKITLVKKFLTKYEDKNPDTDYDWMGVRTDNYPTDPPSDYDLTTDTASTTTASGNWSLYKWNHVRGRDGDNYERVYLKTKTKCDPDFPKEGGVYSFGTYTDSSGSHSYQDPEYLPAVDNYDSNEHEQQRFSDDPKGVDPTYRYEWMAERRKKFNTETHQVEWFPFSKPSLWARYSEDGKNGGGIQIRYISVSSSISSLTIDSNSLTSDPPISTIGGTPMSWKSNTAGLTIDSENFLWMTQREYTEGEITHNNWNTPVRLSGEDGEPGKDGSNLEFIYKRSKSLPTSSTHPGTEPYLDKEFEDDDYVPEGWTDSPSGVGYFTENGSTVFYKYEWAAQRTKPAGVNQSWSSWSPVFVWSAYGDAGMDGDGVEYVFFRWDGPSDPEDDNKFLKTPSIPVAIDSRNNRIEWNGKVYLKDNPNNPPQSDDWLPKDWSSDYSFLRWDANCGYYNPQGEWIPVVKVTDNDSTRPTSVNPNNSETNIYWEDEPKGVGKFTEGGQEVYHIREWVSMRKRINGGDWGPFSEPKLWASFGSDVHISGGRWIINGQDCGQAEGKDGTGVSIKGSVDVVLKKDVTGTKKSLQEVNPDLNSSNYNSVLLGDCYVVTDTRHLYTCINDTDWPDSYSETWDFRSNWEDIGEFQGEGSYMHIAWATDSAVNIQNGQIQYVSPYYTRYEDLANNVEYNWIGICTDHNELDPPDNYGDTSYNPEDEETWNWKKYKWNHVKGKDGSDYEKVYLRTKTNTPPEFADGYQNASSYQSPEYLPAVKNYSSSQHSGVVSGGTCTFTDDPVGVEAAWPYEWMAERKKKFDSSTGLMKWFAFSDPSLWATYSFDGLSANLTKPSDNIVVDSLGTVVGGLGSSPNYRLYTEVKIWDPNKDNGTGGYLTYQSTTGDVQPGKYKLSISNKTPSHITTSIVSSSGRINITGLGTNSQIINTNQYSFTITATVFGEKTFSFVYTITVTHLEQTYFTYSLSNDYDSITYRTKTKQYDGLPVETIIRAQINGKTIGNASEISLDRGYMKSVTVTSSSFYITGTEGTETFTKTVNSNIVDNAFDSYGSEENIVIKNSSGTDTGLRLNIFSNGTVRLSRKSSGTDVDLPDAKHYLDISCVVVYMGVEYPSIVKRFTISEITDSTLYDLILSKTNVIERLGVYSPSNITAKVKVTDENGENTYTPNSSSGRVGTVGNIYVKFFKNNAANLPSTYSSTNTNFFYPCNSITSSLIQNNTITAVVIDTQSSVYHDIQEITISHEVPESSVDITPSQFIVDCNSSGKVSSTRYLDFTAWLKWGGVTCTKSQLVAESCSISQTMEGTYTSPSSLTIADDGTVSGRYTFTANQPLTSGEITITLTGSIGGDTTVAYGTISVIAQKQGQPGDFKSTAFIKTYTDIKNWRPMGGSYSSPKPTGFSGHSMPTGAQWEDGIPAGEETLWSSTATFYGSGATHTWSFPKIVRDSETYDVEFAFKQSNGNVPSLPVKYDEATTTNKCNAHRPTSPNISICTTQIWYDPEEDSGTIQSNYDKFYWKAEREIINGSKKPWVITQIKGESEPNVMCDTPIIVIETDPTGKLSSSETFKFKTWLRLGETIQIPTSQTGSDYNNSVIDSIDDTFQSSDNSVEWEVTLIPNTILSNTGITITMSNASCSASKTIQIVFERRNRSQFKSFVFKRFASTPSADDAPSTTATGGSYENNGLPTGTSGRDSGWSDGLPTSGTDPIYMSSRTFYSDNSQSTSWSTPVRMSDTDIFDVEFSLSIGKPNDPPDNVSQRNNAGWYDPNRSPARDDWDQMRWMATRTKTGNSWGNWAINKIKGETGDTGTGISSITSWYKAFDTLDVVIPSASNENETDGWTKVGDLTGAGWVNSYIKPTKENPYLWKFIRTEYEHPYKVVHDGLEMIQVWSENMINPNLLEDTEFTDINHISAWTQAGKPFNNTYSGTITTGIESNAYNNKNSFYVSSSNCNVSIYMLQQYVTGKIVPSEWYTLSFWVKCSNSGNNTIHVSIKFGNPSTVSLDETSSLNYSNDTSSDQAYIQLKNISNSWSRRTITFKSSDPTSSNYYEYIQFMMLKTTGTSRRFDFCMPKLEIGKIATDYVASLVKDPYPRLTVWGTGKQYYRGNYGEPYLDAVTYGANWFRCRNTHMSSDSNKPVIGQTTAYWEPAQNLDFIVTDLLLAETAFIKGLTVGGLKTGNYPDPHVEMKGSDVYFFGSKQFANIRMSVDADGMAYLQFYDKNNNFLYDLGPRGINWLKTVEVPASWSDVVYYRKINNTSSASGLYLENIPSSSYTRTGYQQFSAKLVNGVAVSDGTYATTDAAADSANGKYFTTTNISSTYWATGLHYFTDDTLNKMTEFWYMEKYGNTGDEAINELKNDLRYYGFSDDFLEQLTYEVINPDVHKLKYKILVRRFVYFDNGVIKYPYGLYQYRDVADGDPISGFSMTL